MNYEKIKLAIEELLKHMGFSFESVEIADASDSKHPRFIIRTDESALLIGAKGENLGAFNYIIKRIVSKASPDDPAIKFLVDVNGYHEKALEAIKTKAKIMSERARSFKADIELEPMSSYDRMLIHSFLDGTPDIKTESVGDGAERRVVIKYTGSL
jgi:spoIIIJ-associated protein